MCDNPAGVSPHCQIHTSFPVCASVSMAAAAAEVAGSSWLLSSGAFLGFLTLLLLFILLTALCSDCRRLAAYSLLTTGVLHHTTEEDRTDRLKMAE